MCPTDDDDPSHHITLPIAVLPPLTTMFHYISFLLNITSPIAETTMIHHLEETFSSLLVAQNDLMFAFVYLQSG